MTPIPYVSTYIRRQREYLLLEGLQRREVYRVVGWSQQLYPVINLPEYSGYICHPSFWEDVSYEENLKEILE